MAIHLTNISLESEQPRAGGTSILTVAGDVTLPGSLREEAHVLHAAALAVAEGMDALQDRAGVKGRVVFSVLYTHGDPVQVSSIEATADFTHMCDLPGTCAGDEVLANVQVEQVEAHANGGRMTMRATVRVNARAVGCETLETLGAVQGDQVQQRLKEIRVSRTVSHGKHDALIREELDLPQELDVRETLYARATPVLHDVTGGQGRLGLTGEVLLEAVHLSAVPGKPIVTTRHTLPVQQAVDLNGEAGELLHGRMTVKDVAVASQEHGDGMVLRAEVVLGLDGWVDQEQRVSVLDDAYTTAGENLRLSRTNAVLRTGREEQHAVESFKTNFLLPEDAMPVRTQLASFAMPVVTRWEQQGQRLLVEGVMYSTMIYLSDDGTVPVSATVETPFRMFFSAQAQQEDFISLQASNAEIAPITSDRAELRCILHLHIEGLRAEQYTLVAQASTVPADAQTKGIVLCYAQPGDTVWDVCRRYRVTEQELQALNPGAGESIQTGQGIVIWHRNAQD